MLRFMVHQGTRKLLKGKIYAQNVNDDFCTYIYIYVYIYKYIYVYTLWFSEVLSTYFYECQVYINKVQYNINSATLFPISPGWGHK